MAAPWFKLYSKEILSDPKVKLLDHDHLGKLLLLWAFANEDGCCIPSDPEAIGKLLGVANKNQMVKHLVWIKRFFAPVEGDDSRLISLRLKEEQEAYESKCEQLRLNGQKGGRPRKPKAEPSGYPSAEPNVNQTQTEVGSGKKEKDSTPTPSGPGKRSRRGRGEILEAFSPEASRIVGELRPIWRKEDPDGRPIRVDLSLWGQRLDEILRAHPEVTPDLLIEAGRGYLGSERFRYQAPQFFFGVGKEGAEAAWVGYVRLLITKRKSEVPHAS
jgi:uncharacterized protein YdaU (DUF1376 family)